jgi:hypothetical protein
VTIAILDEPKRLHTLNGAEMVAIAHLYRGGAPWNIENVWERVSQSTILPDRAELLKFNGGA